MPRLNITTARLTARTWRPAGDDAPARRRLEAALAAILTPGVLAHLPPPLQLDHRAGGVSAWLDARTAESEVLRVNLRDSGQLVGLAILAPDPDAAAIPVLHIGYLLAETAWGRGLATELLQGLVAALDRGGPVRLVAGVDRRNPASARVLRKAGFTAAPERSTPDTVVFVRHPPSGAPPRSPE